MGSWFDKDSSSIKSCSSRQAIMAKTERAGSTWVGMQNVGAVALITKPGKSENLSQALGAIKQAETGG